MLLNEIEKLKNKKMKEMQNIHTKKGKLIFDEARSENKRSVVSIPFRFVAHYLRFEFLVYYMVYIYSICVCKPICLANCFNGQKTVFYKCFCTFSFFLFF